MQFERKVRNTGDSLMLVIPADLVRWLSLEENDDVMIQTETGKHGKFVSFWKKAK